MREKSCTRWPLTAAATSPIAPPPAPAVPLTTGENTVALPAAPTPPTPVPAGGGEAEEEEPFGELPGPAKGAMLAAHHKRAPHRRAITPTAAALVHSVDKQLGRKAVKGVRVYVKGHCHTYKPASSHNFPLYTGEAWSCR
jgi:hypothetical protein